MFLARFIDMYSLIVLASVLISWFPVPQDHPIVNVLHTLTEPLLAPIRRILPDMGGLDFSPMVLIILLQMLRQTMLTV